MLAKTRQEAFELLCQYVTSESLRKHVLAVEGAMVAYAGVFGEDTLDYSLVGLLHDLDYEQYPEAHPMEAVRILEEKGFADHITEAVAGHADRTGVARTTRLAKTLYAVDELASFVVAVALVRPQAFSGMTVKSVRKKLKDKAFAKAVDRDALEVSARELGVELPDHIQTVVQGLEKHEEYLRGHGFTLL